MSQDADDEPVAGSPLEAAGPPSAPFGLDRFTLGIAVGVVALVVALFLVVLGQPTDAGPVDESRPAGVVHNYYLALLRDDPKTAYAYLSADAQARLPYERFAARPAYRGPQRRLRIDEEHLEGDTARVLVRWTYTSGGFFPFSTGEYSNEQTIVLRLENGAWKIAQQPFGPP